jgi:hypothetical protein
VQEEPEEATAEAAEFLTALVRGCQYMGKFIAS